MRVELEAYTERTVPLPAPPETVASYFSENELLLSLLVGHERVKKLAKGHYRVETRGFHAMGFSLTPSFDVTFEDFLDRTEMSSRDCQLMHASAFDLDLSAHFKGEAQFHPSEAGTELFCWTQAWATVHLPLPRIFPQGPIKSVLEAIMQGTLDTLSARFVPLIQSDFERRQGNRA